MRARATGKTIFNLSSSKGALGEWLGRAVLKTVPENVNVCEHLKVSVLKADEDNAARASCPAQWS